MRRFLTLGMGCLLGLATGMSAACGAELRGSVAQVNDQAIVISLDASQLPSVGDALAVVVETADAGRALVAQGRVTSAQGQLVLGTIDQAIGTVRAGQQVIVRPSFLGATSGETPHAAEQQKLEGVWQCVATLRDGQPDQAYVGVLGAMFGNQLTFIFRTAEGRNLVQEATFTVDPTQQPKHFDWVDINKPGFLDRRIYEIDGDTMRWGMNAPGAERPTSFETARYVFTCERLRPGQ